jgi:hypothetical protein
MFLSQTARAQPSMSWRIWISSAVLPLSLAMVFASYCHVRATAFCSFENIARPPLPCAVPAANGMSALPTVMSGHFRMGQAFSALDSAKTLIISRAKSAT